MFVKQKVKHYTHSDAEYSITYWDTEILHLTQNALIVNAMSIRFARRSIVDFMMINNLKGHTNGHILYFTSDDPMFFIKDDIVKILIAEGLNLKDDYVIFWKQVIPLQTLVDGRNKEMEDEMNDEWDDEIDDDNTYFDCELESRLNLCNSTLQTVSWIDYLLDPDGTFYVKYKKPKFYTCLNALLNDSKWNRTTFKRIGQDALDFKLPHLIFESVKHDEFLRIEKRRIPIFMDTKQCILPYFDEIYPPEMESRIIAIMVICMESGITFGISIEKISSNYKRETLAYFANHIKSQNKVVQFQPE